MRPTLSSKIEIKDSKQMTEPMIMEEEEQVEWVINFLSDYLIFKGGNMNDIFSMFFSQGGGMPSGFRQREGGFGGGNSHFTFKFG